MNGVILSDQQIATLQRFVDLVLDWNEKINLVSRKDGPNIWYPHVLHSLSLLFFIKFPEGDKVFDLGTGGGFPGIPLAILREDLRFTLCDSIRKKTVAVQSMADTLHLANVQIVNGRAEEIGRSAPHRHAYDVVLARAVAPLNDLIKWARPLATSAVKDSPHLITLKGGDLEDEIREATAKSRPRKIETTNLVFDGSIEIGLESKKILQVYF